MTNTTPKVQEYIKKNYMHLSIGISVDGNKEKHDAQRVRPDGTGSFEIVKKVVPLWLKQFPGASTKATFAHDDLIHLKDSIITLWDMGIEIVSANVVFEDVWKEGDDIIFEKQLIELADYILENKLWDDYSVRFFDPNIGLCLTENEKNSNYCGTGHMIAIDYKGDIYPCIRYTPFTLNNTGGYKIGNIETGINYDLIRPFENLTLKAQSKKECINCEIATGCSWCSGYNYDDAKGKTLFHRAINTCLMHKANVRANEYFWEKLSLKLDIENPRDEIKKKRNRIKEDINKIKYIQIIAEDNIVPHCCYRNTKKTNNMMSKETFEEAIGFCKNKGFQPVIIGNNFYMKDEKYIHIGVGECDDIVIHNNTINRNISENNILLITKISVINLFDMVCELLGNKKVQRVNIIIVDLDKWNENIINEYKRQLELISQQLYEQFLNSKPVDINVLTDIFENIKIRDCGSGIDSYAIAPNGKIYICPAFYFDNEDDFIGDLKNGITEINKLIYIENSNICCNCDANQCKRCLYLNKKMTTEINTPPKIQCLVSHVERNISRKLELRLIKENLIEPLNFISKINYEDPLDKCKAGEFYA